VGVDCGKRGAGHFSWLRAWYGSVTSPRLAYGGDGPVLGLAQRRRDASNRRRRREWMGMGAPPPELETLAPAPLKRTQAGQNGNEMENGPTGRGAAYDAEFLRYTRSKPGLAREHNLCGCN
jgi:hypothetical protein